MVCVSKGGFKIGEAGRNIELARKGLFCVVLFDAFVLGHSGRIFVILKHEVDIFHQRKPQQKSYNLDFIGPPYSKMHIIFAKHVKIVKD